MKLNCVIDCNSCVILSNIFYRQKSLLYYLNLHSNLIYSKEVGKELKDHRFQNLKSFIFKTNSQRNTKRYTIDKYEDKFLNRVLTSRDENGDKNKGEIDNFILSVDLTNHLKYNGIIFITDDKKFINGKFNDWKNSFPLIKMWTSYEVLLFLFSREIIESINPAKDLIRDIISFTKPPKEERSEKTNIEAQLLKNNYTSYIDNINKFYL